MKKYLFILLALGIQINVGMAQTVKTISLLFSEDYIQLTEQGDGTVKVDFTNEFYDRFFDDGIFSKISEDCLFVYYGEEGSDGVEPYLIWGECQVPIEDDEEYESFSLEATEKLIADNILLSKCTNLVYTK